MIIKLKSSNVLYAEETNKHILIKCGVKNTYDVFNDDGEYIKTSTQFWNTFCYCDDFGNMFGVSDKGQLFDFLLSNWE